MEQIKHECGIAMIRLLKPLSYYKEKYGTERYALNKLYLMMEKQHNRGQEGAGLASVKIVTDPGQEYMFREKALGKDAIANIFSDVHKQIDEACQRKEQAPFIGELYMGHLRYSTTGRSGMRYVHPFLRRNNWKAKNLCICGNFNMTNIDEVFQMLADQGQYPRINADAYIMLELMGHRLDREVERNYVAAREKNLSGREITAYIDNHVEIANVLSTTMPHFDGGYVICGLTGSGELFSMRDPCGIRPAFWYADDEIVAVASERPVLQTTFALEYGQIHELHPGEALIVNGRGELSLKQIMSARKLAACSFERIYFSRGNDRNIHRERKQLGYQLRDNILKAIGHDIAHTVFSYIPNTAEVAYYGMVEGIRSIYPGVRADKVVSKDIKLRTFITEGGARNDLAGHVYDITYGTLTPYVDNLVVIDDSIVRGTTLRESIIRILDRLHPKKIVIVSSSPQVRYPDCYGIDMSHMKEFIAFHAAIALLKEKGMSSLIDVVYRQCKEQEGLPIAGYRNYVRRIYDTFTDEQISQKIVELLRPADIGAEVEIVYQSLEGLHAACPDHPGDWYFSGDYPTPGGYRMLNQAFIDYYENDYLNQK
ncbi:MAG: amidophosphoribosyltransferase [Bacteroidales bacterium]|nr:amidophosphoribosyltransferase [Bacteroidales bacterium]